ncbi:MAG TPA: hypothetical protein VFE14_03475 [Micromonosporaceae bacterium]|jgi:hypothetical protein|nr:hypothetical protein [Micromonosporaceae bacterium]
MRPENLGNGGTATQDRFAGQLGYRGRRDGTPLAANPIGVDGDLTVHNGAVPTLEEPALNGPARPSHDGPPRPSLADLDSLGEPGGSFDRFSTAGWLDGAGGSLADHPLLRGLLLELPPKGTTPPAGWLDRWFEAARSILELLYVQEGQRR